MAIATLGRALFRHRSFPDSPGIRFFAKRSGSLQTSHPTNTGTPSPKVAELVKRWKESGDNSISFHESNLHRYGKRWIAEFLREIQAQNLSARLHLVRCDHFPGELIRMQARSDLKSRDFRVLAEATKEVRRRPEELTVPNVVLPNPLEVDKARRDREAIANLLLGNGQGTWTIKKA